MPCGCGCRSCPAGARRGLCLWSGIWGSDGSVSWHQGVNSIPESIQNCVTEEYIRPTAIEYGSCWNPAKTRMGGVAASQSTGNSTTHHTTPRINWTSVSAKRFMAGTVSYALGFGGTGSRSTISSVQKGPKNNEANTNPTRSGSCSGRARR